jgi:hypothetical protein
LFHYLDVILVDGVSSKRTQVFMADGTRGPDHVRLVMIKAMRALTRYAAAGIEDTEPSSAIASGGAVIQELTAF